MFRSFRSFAWWVAAIPFIGVAGQSWCFAQTPEWVATYDGPGSGEDTGWAVAFDPHGDVFVVGTAGDGLVVMKVSRHGHRLWTTTVPPPVEGSYYWIHTAVDPFGNLLVVSSLSVNTPRKDYMTMKFDPHGNLAWYVTYDGPAHLRDTAGGLAVDGRGNVYVTGRSAVSEDFSEYATIKYSPEGKLQWVAHYAGLREGDNGGQAIAVDTAGNVYVAGNVPRPGLAYVFETVKYNAFGAQQWSARFDNAGNGSGYVNGLTIDACGNVYVAGYWYVGGEAGNFQLVKYNSDGGQDWATRYDGPGHSDDWLTGMAGDSDGNVYLTGWCVTHQGPWFSIDYSTVKINSRGMLEWAAQFDGPGHLDDLASAVGVDADGNVYVTGQAWATREDFATIKYSADGRLLWAKLYTASESSTDGAIALAVAPHGHVVVTGTSSGDIATVAYDGNGNELWGDRFDSSGGQTDVLRAVAVDSDGSIIVTGDSPGHGVGGEIATIKYDSDGKQRWIARHPGAAGYGRALAVDDRGDVIVAGRSGWQFATIKYKHNGHEDWTAHFQSRENGIDGATAVAVDSHRNIYVTGTSLDTDYFTSTVATVKYDEKGKQQWAAVVEVDPEHGPVVDAGAIAVNDAGNVYVAGAISNTVGGYGGLTIKYDASGHQRWMATYGAPDSHSTGFGHLSLDPAGNPIVTGASDHDIVTIKYDSNGARRWIARYDGPDHGDDTPYAMAVDGEGNVYVAGSTYRAETNNDFLTIKYDADGAQRWIATYDGPEHNRDSATVVAVDAAGGVYVTGTANEYGANRRIVTIRYDPNGHEVWLAAYGGSVGSATFATDLALDSAGNVVAAGGTWSSVTGYDYLVVKYSGCSIPGEGNRESSRDGRDIQRLIDCLTSRQGHCQCLDLDGNGAVDSGDVQQLVATLLGE